MLISCAMRSRVAAVGVGFLLNSTSRVTSWSWVARWRLLFFCCWVKVLLRGGRREADPDAPVALDVDGDEAEFGGDEDAVAVPAPIEKSGVSVNKDMIAVLIYRLKKRSSRGSSPKLAFAYVSKGSMRDDPADKWSGV